MFLLLNSRRTSESGDRGNLQPACQWHDQWHFAPETWEGRVRHFKAGNIPKNAKKCGKLHWSWTNPLMWGLFWWYNKNTAPWINSPTAQVRENQDYDQESRVLNEAIITNSVRFRSTSPSTYLSIFQQFLKNQRKLNLIIHTLRNVKMPRSEKNPVIGFVWK